MQPNSPLKYTTMLPFIQYYWQLFCVKHKNRDDLTPAKATQAAVVTITLIDLHILECTTRPIERGNRGKVSRAL